MDDLKISELLKEYAVCIKEFESLWLLNREALVSFIIDKNSQEGLEIVNEMNKEIDIFYNKILDYQEKIKELQELIGE